MKNFIIYESTTGKIRRTGVCPDEMFFIQAQIDESIIEEKLDILNIERYYVVNGSIIERPKNPAILNKDSILANGEDTGIISKIPNPSTIYINKQQFIVSDGIFEFTLDNPGIYNIQCSAIFPYLRKEFLIYAY